MQTWSLSRRAGQNDLGCGRTTVGTDLGVAFGRFSWPRAVTDAGRCAGTRLERSMAQRSGLSHNTVGTSSPTHVPDTDGHACPPGHEK